MTNRRPRGLYVPLAALLATATLAPTVSAAEADRLDDRAAVTVAASRDDGRFLQEAARGATAVRRLGGDLAQVARLNGMSPEAFEELLTTDATTWVHPNGLLYYVDDAPDDLQPEAPQAAPFDYGQTFQLHSRPGSDRTIYLDFNGQYVSGTAWNELGQNTVIAQNHPAFDLDGSPGSFSHAEMDVIQDVWQRVSEDYAPFDVDVTTADPGLGALRRDTFLDTQYGTRALITPSTAASNGLCGGGCGGVAFNSIFNVTANQLSNWVGKPVAGSDYAHPAWVFPHNLGNDAKAIADATSHEIGHNLGLDHDGDAKVAYYEGHGAWAPIMGSSYYRPIAQWSSGEYAGANNLQDDLTVITQHGLAYQADEHGDDAAGATPLLSAGGTIAGLITTRTDKDYFALPQDCAGSVMLSAVPAPASPNLDIRLRVLTGDGTLVASDNPVSAFSTEDVASGMAAATTVTAVSGTPLFVEVDGVGARDAATTGYSDYASIGRYTLTTSGCGTGTDVVAVAFQQSTHSAGEAAGEALLTVVRSGDTSGPSTVSYSRTGGSATPGNDFTLAPGVVSFASGEAQKTISVALTDDAIDEPNETVEVTLTDPSTGTALGGISTSTLTITDDDEPAGLQPDLLISTKQARGYIGDGVYNIKGSGQTKQQSATRGQLCTFFVKVTNDGPTKERISLFATKAPKGAKVTYSNEGTDYTAALTGVAGVYVDLGPDQYALLRVDIKPGNRARIGSLKSALVTARSTSGLTDVTKAIVKVVKR